MAWIETIMKKVYVILIILSIVIISMGCSTGRYLKSDVPGGQKIIVTGEGYTLEHAIDRGLIKAVDLLGGEVSGETFVVDRSLKREKVVSKVYGWVVNYNVIDIKQVEKFIIVSMEVNVMTKEGKAVAMVTDIAGGIIASPFRVIFGTVHRFKENIKEDLNKLMK